MTTHRVIDTTWSEIEHLLTQALVWAVGLILAILFLGWLFWWCLGKWIERQGEM